MSDKTEPVNNGDSSGVGLAVHGIVRTVDSWARRKPHCIYAAAMYSAKADRIGSPKLSASSWNISQVPLSIHSGSRLSSAMITLHACG